jgi:hypothetical protein
MPIVGYIDDAGARVPFEDVRAGKGKFAAPLPVLLSMVGQLTDPHDYADLTASFIAGALWRQKLLERRHDIYTNWYDSYFMWMGTAVHSCAERAAAAIEHYDVITERRMAMLHKSGLWIGAITDLLERHGEDQPWELWDYKSTGVYTSVKLQENGVRAEKPDWVRQFSVGRWLARQDTWTRKLTECEKCAHTLNQRLDVGPIKVCLLYRDWKPADAERAKPVEVYDVPVLPDYEVETLIDSSVADYLQLKDMPDDELPPCEPTELWLNENPKSRVNFGHVQRCENYCAASDHCNQWKHARKLAEASVSGRHTMETLNAAAEQVGKAATKRG